MKFNLAVTPTPQTVASAIIAINRQRPGELAEHFPEDIYANPGKSTKRIQLPLFQEYVEQRTSHFNDQSTNYRAGARILLIESIVCVSNPGKTITMKQEVARAARVIQ
jgi:hypothetical protein